MKISFIKGLFVGIGFTLLFAAVGLGTYTYRLYKQAEPGFKVSKKSQNYSSTQKNEITNALIKLSGITDFLGIDEASVLFTGSTAAVLSESSPLLARYYFARAIKIASIVAADRKFFNPLLEARLHYSLFLSDQGETQEAKAYLDETIEIAQVNSQNSYWIENLKQAKKFFDKNR